MSLGLPIGLMIPNQRLELTTVLVFVKLRLPVDHLQGLLLRLSPLLWEEAFAASLASSKSRLELLSTPFCLL